VGCGKSKIELTLGRGILSFMNKVCVIMIDTDIVGVVMIDMDVVDIVDTDKAIMVAANVVNDVEDDICFGFLLFSSQRAGLAHCLNLRNMHVVLDLIPS
jgi:hypothetical protein